MRADSMLAVICFSLATLAAALVALGRGRTVAGAFGVVAAVTPPALLVAGGLLCTDRGVCGVAVLLAFVASAPLVAAGAGIVVAAALRTTGRPSAARERATAVERQSPPDEGP